MHDHSHPGNNHPHHHDHAAHGHHHSPSRRDFLRKLMGTTLAGASIVELAWHRAAWARSAAPTDASDLFDLHKAADGVFFAHARPQTVINCNAAIFVRSKDVVIVDAHSKPSAAASLIAQIRRDITEKPVRYVINTHFHWDHTQGNQAYAHTGSKVDFIATSQTKQLMSQYSVDRLKQSLDEMSKQIDALHQRAGKSSSAAEKAFCASEISHIQAYQAEMKDFTLELPTITFDNSYELKDPAFDLQLGFHGRSHTAGDVFAFCPSRRAIATGDASHCWVPNIGDGYPRKWPATIDAVAKLDFQSILGGHGPMQSSRTIMTCQRNFIEELTQKVAEGKAAGISLDEMKKRFTVASLRSLQSNGYADFLARTQAAEMTHFGAPPPLQNDIDGCTAAVYNNLDRA
ncbi:MAG TPA: MBL fold metallo-hydrolase [Terracidiphilus sp.]|nr:MBL fold metallo-hydrolase [Terracidiphilus sp.]